MNFLGAIDKISWQMNHFRNIQGDDFDKLCYFLVMSNISLSGSDTNLIKKNQVSLSIFYISSFINNNVFYLKFWVNRMECLASVNVAYM